MLSYQNIFNYTKQMHNIYSLHIFTVFLLHVFGVTTSPGRTLCSLLQTTCCYAAIIYGYYNSYVVNIKGVAHFEGKTWIKDVLRTVCWG